MNEEEIVQFLNAFIDFMKHSEVEELNFKNRSEYEEYEKMSKKVIEMEIEKKAEELEITVDYYLTEFM
jgi:hypothetical protein